jgi:protein-disulfide isomerase
MTASPSSLAPTFRRAGLCLLLLPLTTLTACKKEGGTAAKTDPAGGTPVAAGADPCADYSKALCEQLGAESPSCESVKTATGLMPPAACKAGLGDLAFSKGKVAGMKKVCEELVSKLCKDVGPETQSCEMVKAQTAKFPPERCQMMMGNYQQVLAQLQKMEEGNKPLAPEKQEKIAADDAPSFGPKDAKVTIVEFSDFQCPYCVKAAEATKQIKAKYSDKVRFVFRQFPLSFHQNAHAAAQASLAAHAQGKFWQYHDTLFENQSALTDADLEKHAQKVGLNMALFKKAMQSKTFKAPVDADMALGGEVAVNGTPSMFINGKRVSNPTSFEAISQLIDKELGS